MSRYFLLSLSFFLTISTPITLRAESGAPALASSLINQMSEASRSLNYIGVFMYRRGNQVDTMKLIHKSSDYGEQERLVSLSGNAREVIRDNDSVTCIFPENEKIMVEKAQPRDFFSAKLPEPIEKIDPYYEFHLVSSERIAGRDSWVVNIRPRDEYRYGYQLWIDKTSKLLLRSDVKTLSGKVIEQIIYADLQVLDDIEENLLLPGINGSRYSWQNRKYEPVGETVKTNRWTVHWLPSGFVMTEQENKLLMGSLVPMNHLAYSDGLATVSVFIEKQSEEEKPRHGASSMGGVNAYSIISDGYQMTAVGEVPMATVEKMATSIQLSE